MKILRFNSPKLEKIYNRGFVKSRRVEERVRQIIDDVRLLGDDALIRYTKRFDGVKLTSRQLRVSENEIKMAKGWCWEKTTSRLRK
jgi:histidinol dehydrogenase